VSQTDERDETLRSGELKVLGRIRSASNATFLCEALRGADSVHCVYKPVAGEQPLWDFPDGTLASREFSAFAVSAALSWDVVPYTLIRDGPAGPGMVQLWIDQSDADADADADDEGDTGREPGLVDLWPTESVPESHLSVLRAYDYTGGEVTLIHADDPWLRRMAVFDVIVNNADRKGGHILRGLDGRVYGVDHGISMHAQNKLRTVLWGWAGKPIDDPTLEGIAGLQECLAGSLGEELREHLTAVEVAALCRRVRALLDDPVMPDPNHRNPIPWPAF
jgi:uncharacterized repeat protein (TIGR03843 family)